MAAALAPAPRAGKAGVAGAPIPMVRDDYGESVREKFQEFLQEFELEDDQAQQNGGASIRKYAEEIERMKINDMTTLHVDWDDVCTFDNLLSRSIEDSFYRFEPYLRKAVQNFVSSEEPTYAEDDKGDKEFFVSFHNMHAVSGVRAITTSDHIGRLCSLKGTVTRTSEVKPELLFATFQCLDCNTIVRDVEQQFRYTEPRMCPNTLCNNCNKWHLMMDLSRFIDWQRVRIQESVNEVPPGSLPRSLDVILRNEAVEKAKPGDKCVFTGTVVVAPDVAGARGTGPGERVESVTRNDNLKTEGVTGLKALGPKELHYKLYFLACSCSSSDAKLGINIREEIEEEYMLEMMSPEELELVNKMKADPDIYRKVASSIAPAVFGHQDVKMGVLLMLLGGVHKETTEKIPLRGDINICIVGDPSTAKSQFLKYVQSFLPRAVYTSGKTSSAAGLTASVVRDPDTGEFCIDAGALMLADNGICCIDEFEKMDIKDQVAIHEAMEQQTISISKAGILAQLNARTSVLAAANPVGGRYDKSKSLRYNVSLSAPIMSRFDLFFVVLDECDEVSDYNIARHIVGIHKDRDMAIDPEYTMEEMQRYIRYARTVKPRITRAAAQLLVRCYARLRQNDVSMNFSTAYRITVRQLESLVRLSEALARLHCDQEVKPVYVREAFRLLRKSILYVENDDVDMEDDGDLAADDDEDGGGGGGGQGLGLGEGSVVDEAKHDNDMCAATDAAETEAAQREEAARDAAAKEEAAKEEAAKEEVGGTAKPKAAKTTIRFETYKRISSLLVHGIRLAEQKREEANAGDGDATVADEHVGVSQADLVGWYLKTEEANFDTEEQLREEEKRVRLVINSLINRDGVLWVVPSEDDDNDDVAVQPDAGDGDAGAAAAPVPKKKSIMHRILAVHPNYVEDA